MSLLSNIFEITKDYLIWTTVHVLIVSYQFAKYFCPEQTRGVLNHISKLSLSLHLLIENMQSESQAEKEARCQQPSVDNPPSGSVTPLLSMDSIYFKNTSKSPESVHLNAISNCKKNDLTNRE
jgi:hypothetical protein